MQRTDHGNIDHSDKIFTDCLKEIRLAYLELSKPIRLRIEKWVEKLVMASDRNLTWKKHRNAYAKLLLGMIISKTLSDPFHQFPPDGPLPTFPSQHNHKLKSMLGAHESSFWRELFQNLEASTDANSKSASDASRIVEFLERPTLSPSRPVNREIQNLTSLIRQQESKIQLLEQQLRDERLQHELQIQRMQYAHRIELGSITDVNSFNQSLHRSVASVAAANTSYVPIRGSFDGKRNPAWPDESSLQSVSITALKEGDQPLDLSSETGFWNGQVRNNSGSRDADNSSFLSGARNASDLKDRISMEGSFIRQPPTAPKRPANSRTENASHQAPSTGQSFSHAREDEFLSFLKSEDRSILSKPVEMNDTRAQEASTTIDPQKTIFVTFGSQNDDDYLDYLQHFQDEIKSLQGGPKFSTRSL